MKRKTYSLLIASISIDLFVFLSCSSSKPVVMKEEVNPWVKSTTAPVRLLLITIDQFQDKYIQTYGLKNFQSFKNYTLRFPNAIVGHLPSIDILSHAVLTSGLLPKNLPFQDRIFKDPSGLLGKKNAHYSLDHLKRKQFDKLLKGTADTSLHTRLKYGHRGDTFTISNSSSNAYAMGSPYSDLIITLDSPKKSAPLKGWCFPTGVDVPDYFMFPLGGRFFLECSQSLKGNLFDTGEDSKHSGGDDWVTDAALEVMKQETDWRAIFVNYASIGNTHTELGKQLGNLDNDFGKIIRSLEEKRLLKETIIVLTSTHGKQEITDYHGIVNNTLKLKVCGEFENFSNKIVPPELTRLVKTNQLRAVTFDAGLRFFLTGKDTVQISKMGTLISELPGVAEVYTKQDAQYIRTFRHKNLTGEDLEWAREKHQDLVSTMNNKNAPDIMALLFKGVGYGSSSDFGSAQKESCQKIPLLIWAPNLLTNESPYPIRLVDLNPNISRIMNMTLPATLDGSKAAVDAAIIEP